MALRHVVALAGGVGGAKLAAGLARVLAPEQLTIIGNVGDDFRHYGLHISPDLDTVMYTLAGVADPVKGWGVQDESWQMLDMLRAYGETPWFGLGDRDLATHLLRRVALDAGEPLTNITARLCAALGAGPRLLPVTDDRFATMLDTLEQGTLPFQEYFVKHRWQPTVTRIWYDGQHSATLTPAVIQVLDEADTLIICPSNPLLSIDPILAVGDFRARLAALTVPRVAVSPIVNGRALKGPAAKIMPELGYNATVAGVWDYYRGLVDILLVHSGDAQDGPYVEKNIVMQTPADRQRLAAEILEFIQQHL